MRTVIAALALVALTTACERRENQTADADGDRSGMDTVVTSETVRDTAIVRADTSIDVDTVKKTDNLDDRRDD